jgi:hypothetical protein
MSPAGEKSGDEPRRRDGRRSAGARRDATQCRTTEQSTRTTTEQNERRDLKRERDDESIAHRDT